MGSEASQASKRGARQALREATHAVHERLHRQPGFAAVLDGTLTQTAYRDLLTRLYGFHLPFEAALLAAPLTWRRGLAFAGRARLLDADLSALGLSKRDIAALPLAPPPVIDSPAALLGGLYVREGARLGGKLLARKLVRLCGPNGAGCSFFNDEPHDGALWGQLCAELDRVDDDRMIAAMIAAACAAFAAIETWLNAGQPITSTGASP